jgi:hypothetical protein
VDLPDPIIPSKKTLNPRKELKSVELSIVKI